MKTEVRLGAVSKNLVGITYRETSRHRIYVFHWQVGQKENRKKTGKVRSYNRKRAAVNPKKNKSVKIVVKSCELSPYMHNNLKSINILVKLSMV